MEAIIFDLDGTLADTLEDITSALNHVLAELELPTHSPDETMAWVGWGARHLVERAVPSADPALVDHAVRRFREHYGANLIRHTRPYPGVPELLDQLTADGMPMAVLSNKPDEMTRRIIDEVFSRWSFADVRGHRSGVPKKPDPTAALAIADVLGVSARDTVLVGDTAVDVETARAARMTPVCVAWGFRPASMLEETDAALVAHSPHDLYRWIDARNVSEN